MSTALVKLYACSVECSGCIMHFAILLIVVEQSRIKHKRSAFASFEKKKHRDVSIMPYICLSGGQVECESFSVQKSQDGMAPQQLFSIVSGGGRMIGGRGMMANRDIQKGTLILEESPLVECNTRYGTLQWNQNWNNFYTQEATGRSNRIQSATARLNPMDRIAFNRLYAPIAGSGNTDVDRFVFNAFDAPTSNHQVRLFVYRELCFISHSCVPNATVEILHNAIPGSSPRGAMRLVAAQTIPSGSEILINYLARNCFMLHAARAQELQQQWSFTCNCPDCSTQLEIDIDTFH